ncbi:MAG: extracellular solute-binding protein family 5 [Firmicutes bacterium]|nr:extracellular solute-binding protein family 5 [Bacillota bacterium]
MMGSTVKRFLTVLVAGSLMLGVAGCSGATSSDAGQAGSTTGPKELVIAQGTDPLTLDPHRSTVQQALNISMAIAEPLFTLDYKTGEIKPLLGLEAKNLDDKTWQINLRQGVKFTNGEEFTADSVKVSIERIKKPELKSPATIYVRPIEKVEVVDKYTVKLVTSAPSPVIPLYLTRIAMVPPKYLQEKGEEALVKAPVGTGAYKLKEWIKDERVVLTANPDYWGGKPQLDTVTFRSIPETSTRMAALKTGEADIVTQVAAEEVSALEQGGQVKVQSIPGLRLMMYQFNLEKDGPQQDVRVRQALNYAVDKEALVKNILNGNGRVLDGQPVAKEYFGFSDQVKAYPFDPEKAKQLLAEAGYTAAKPLAMTLYAPQGRYNRDKEVAEAIGGMLQAVGVKADVQVMDWGVFIQKLLAKELAPLSFWGASTAPDADLWLGSMMLSGAAYSEWKNPDFDKLVQAGGQTLDKQKRLEIYAQAAQMAHDQAPLIYLYQQVDMYGISNRVQGYVPSPDEGIYLNGVTVGPKK